MTEPIILARQKLSARMPPVRKRERHNQLDIPDDRANNNGVLPTQNIRNKSRRDSTQPRATGHGRDDTALNVGMRTSALGVIGVALIEVAKILLSTLNGGHGRDIETEERAAQHRNCGDEVDVARLRKLHDGGQERELLGRALPSVCFCCGGGGFYSSRV